MKAVLIFSGGIAITATLRALLRAREPLAQTTLSSAWRWSVAATLALAAVWVLSLMRLVCSSSLDQLWYAVGLLLLCPPMAVLGARRPGTAVWTTFVVLPLLAVLGWPLLTAWTTRFEPHPLRLDTPAMLGFVLVLVMGVGNYLGTRFSLSAVLYGVAACLIVGPVSAVAPSGLQGSLTARLLAAIGLGLSCALAVRSIKQADRHCRGFDRIWRDYRDTFGIVWAKRLQDRLNGIARQQDWPVRLEHLGLHWRNDVTPNDRLAAAQKIDQALRWLLRRFVDPEWIDARVDRAVAPSPGPQSAAD